MIGLNCTFVPTPLPLLAWLSRSRQEPVNPVKAKGMAKDMATATIFAQADLQLKASEAKSRRLLPIAYRAYGLQVQDQRCRLP